MATKTTWKSDGDVWVFEEGELAKVTLRGESRQRTADFRVLRVIHGALVETDLKGLSRYDWQGPLVSWSGPFELEVEESESDGDTASSGEGEETSTEGQAEPHPETL
ncbi:hypothetical protein [Paenarthrobacter sp. NPDC057981]|uniref:hypothetical protein n=1 Tax=Paenarthrobacter sp. NPDC057981 TaxID=3346297 RepID=UPI0036D7A9A9